MANNITTLLVKGLPSATPEYLVYDVDKFPNVLYPKIVRDKVLENQVYYKGNTPLNTGATFYDTLPAMITNSVLTTEGEQKQKGLYGVYLGEVIEVVGATANALLIGEPAALTLNKLDRVLVTGVAGIPNGIYKIKEDGMGTESIVVDCVLDSNTMGGAFQTIRKATYLWDEVYVTPLGQYEIKRLADFDKSGRQFYMGDDLGVDSNVLHIVISDPNIVPIVGDIISLQVTQTSEVPTYDSGDSNTNDINSVINTLGTQHFLFTILSSVVESSTPVITYTIVVDKTFKALADVSETRTFFFSLLNRGGLYSNTWEFHEIHRRQLLGDPYDNKNISKPVGRKNYLNYIGAEYLGAASQLKGFMNGDDTPFVLLHFGDKLRDRISLNSGINSKGFEVHFPNLLIQGEQSPAIFVNAAASYNAAGIGWYSPLVLKYPQGVVKRYGWVCHDLRIAVIDDAEVATALGYNSNRNFTLPDNYTSLIPNIGNRKMNSNVNSPLDISSIIDDNGVIRVTTKLAHGLSLGDAVNITGVEGCPVVNTSTGRYWYVQPVDATKFKIYTNTSLSVWPTLTSQDVYTPGTGICYGSNPDYKYFVTYKLRGRYYDSLPMSKLLPFNFTDSSTVNIDNLTGILDVSLPQLTHLFTETHKEGFELSSETKGNLPAPQWDLVVGTFTFDVTDPTTVTGITNVKIIPGELLYNEGTTIQSANHTMSISVSTYLDTVPGVPELQALSTYNLKPGTLKYVELTNSYYKYYESAALGITDQPGWVASNNTGFWLKTDCGLYNLTTTEKIYKLDALPVNLLTGKNKWLIGNVFYHEQSEQYRLTFEVQLPADKWNGTTNPSYEPGNELMNSKLISEIAFLVADKSGNVEDAPYVYAKITPPLKKNNTSSMSIAVSLDF